MKVAYKALARKWFADKDIMLPEDGQGSVDYETTRDLETGFKFKTFVMDQGFPRRRS